MKIIFVHDTKAIPYSVALVKGYKGIETRSKNTLKNLVGEEVMVARTRSGKPTDIVGTITFEEGKKVDYYEFKKLYVGHLVPPGSKFDCEKDGQKWCYKVTQFNCFDEPISMPKNVIRHGRVWAEVMEETK